MPDNEPTWGVIVVHGVGITRPGETVEHLLATLNKFDAHTQGKGPDILAVEDPPEVSLLADGPANQPEGDTDADDDPEDEPAVGASLKGRFPMHMRRVTVNAPPGSSGPKRALVAEVFWADVSGSNRGFWDWGGVSQIVFRMFTLLFHFRYLGHMAATHYRLWSAYCLRWFVYLVSWVLCGPIAGPNIFLFFLVAAHYLTDKGRGGLTLIKEHLNGRADFVFTAPFFIGFGIFLSVLGEVLWRYGRQARWSVKPMLVCAALVGLGIGLASSNAIIRSFQQHGTANVWNLSRAELFGFGACATFLGFFCLRLLRHYEKDKIWYSVVFWFTWSGIATMVLTVLPLAASPEGLQATWAGHRLEHLYENLLKTGSVFNIVLAVFLSWIVTAFAVLGVFVMVLGFPSWCWAFLATRSKAHADAHAAITAAFATTLLQIGFWVLLVPLLGMAALLYMEPGQVTGANNSLFARVWTRFALNLCLGALPVGIALIVLWRRWSLARPFFHASGNNTNPPPIPRLIANSWTVAGLFLATFLGFASFLYSTATGNDWVNELLMGYQWWFVGGGLFVLGLAFLFGRQGLLAGMHILRDIVGHFYRTGILFGSTFWPVADPAKITAEDFADLFPAEMLIERRFRSVLQEMLRRACVSRLIVVAHSQGTIVAIHSLNSVETRMILENGNVREVRLVTMGSPLTHLYRHYFPYRYQPLHTASGEPNGRHWLQLRHVVSHWLNIFRIDDFVGTVVDGLDSFPRNGWVYGKGHMGYWTDEMAVRAFRDWLPGGTQAQPSWVDDDAPREHAAPIS